VIQIPIEVKIINGEKINKATEAPTMSVPSFFISAVGIKYKPVVPSSVCEKTKVKGKMENEKRIGLMNLLLEASHIPL